MVVSSATVAVAADAFDIPQKLTKNLHLIHLRVVNLFHTLSLYLSFLYNLLHSKYHSQRDEAAQSGYGGEGHKCGGYYSQITKNYGCYAIEKMNVCAVCALCGIVSECITS